MIEDVTEIILNLKQVRLKLHGDGPKKGLFEMSGKREVKASDMKVDADVEILNPDLHIATLNRDGDLRMEVDLNGGRGYASADSALADGPAHRGDPDRLAVLAGHEGELPRSRPRASASASTTTS